MTLKNPLMIHAQGLTPSAVLPKLASIQMIDVHIPTVDGHWLILPRYTQPEADARLVLDKQVEIRLAGAVPFCSSPIPNWRVQI